jgi:hypothetical protein
MPDLTREELLAQIAALQRQLTAVQSGTGSMALGPGATAAGQQGVAVGGNFSGTVYIGDPRSHLQRETNRLGPSLCRAGYNRSG